MAEDFITLVVADFTAKRIDPVRVYRRRIIMPAKTGMFRLIGCSRALTVAFVLTVNAQTVVANGLTISQEISPFPVGSTAAPPEKGMLPPLLSSAEAARRRDADTFLMKAERLRSNRRVNISILLAELESKQYDLIDAQLDAVLAKSVADPVYEFVEEDCAGFAEGRGVAKRVDQSVLDAWVNGRPQSPWAHYSEGLRWSDNAWAARGSGWAKDISDAKFEEMNQDDIKARAEIKKSLSLNPKIAMAWLTLLDIDRVDGSLETDTLDYQQGAEQLPSSFLIPDQYMQALEPRWYGSYDLMRRFVNMQLTKLIENPRLWELQGAIAADKGCSSCNDKKWDISLRDYSTALAFEDRPSWLDSAADSAESAQKYALAYRFYERSLKYKPDNFHNFTKLKIMDALCNPKADAAELEAFKSAIDKYQRMPGDCTYYQAELPWGSEPVPDVSNVFPYSVEKETLHTHKLE